MPQLPNRYYAVLRTIEDDGRRVFDNLNESVPRYLQAFYVRPEDCDSAIQVGERARMKYARRCDGYSWVAYRLPVQGRQPKRICPTYRMEPL